MKIYLQVYSTLAEDNLFLSLILSDVLADGLLVFCIEQDSILHFVKEMLPIMSTYKLVKEEMLV